MHISFDGDSIKSMIGQSPDPIMYGGSNVGNVLAWADGLSAACLESGAEATSFKSDGVAVSVSLRMPKTADELNAPPPLKKRRHGNEQVGTRGERYSEWQPHLGKKG